nr:hypothetical protein [Tanacetum cinerariifolium]
MTFLFDFSRLTDDLYFHNTKYTSPALIHKVFANLRRIGKGFLGIETPLFDTMLVQPQVQDVAEVDAEDEDDNEVSTAPTPPSPTQAPSPPLQEPISPPPQAQPTPPSSPPQQQPTQPADTLESSVTILNILMETCATLSQKVFHLEQDKVAQVLEITKLKQRVKKLEKKRRFKELNPLMTLLWMLERMHPNKGEIAKLDADEDVTLVDVDTVVGMDDDTQGRMEEDVTTMKELNVAEPIVFDDEQRYDQKQENIDWNVVVEQMQEKHLDNFKKYQSLKRKPISVAQARKNMIVYLKNMAGYKIQHFKGITYNQVRPIFEREYNHVQTFLKSDGDEEPTKKRGAEETLRQESFKKLRAEFEVLGSSSTQLDIPTVDLAKISEEDVQNMLQIVPVAEFKVEALQVKVGGITEAYQSFKDMLKSFNSEDLDALWRLVKEKFSTAMPTVDREKALWVELKRIYEPNAADVFWKLQRYMHDLLSWKLYTNYGVHQVISTRRHHIFMLTKKDYPLIDVVLLLMLSAKL